MANIVARRVVFKGQVQGVGFRRKVLTISDDFSISGFVKNLPDGDVELVAQGEEPELDAFLAQVDTRLGYLVSLKLASQIPPGFFPDFRIEY